MHTWLLRPFLVGKAELACTWHLDKGTDCIMHKQARASNLWLLVDNGRLTMEDAI